MCYLKMRSEEQLKGNDKYIRARLLSKDMSWFPIRRARSLSLKQQEIKCIQTKVRRNLN